jgi:hypothetical protein
MTEPVEKASMWLPVMEENLVDFVPGYQPSQRYLAEQRYWDRESRKLRNRILWPIQEARWEVERRLHHAAAALRGEDCDFR